MNTSSLQQYFSILIKHSSNEKDEELRSNELYLAKYLMEFILFIITIINESGNKICFNKDTLLMKFSKVFGEEKNKIEISSIDVNDTKNRYIISFLPILFKCRESEFDSEIRLSKNNQSINGWSKYYPSLIVISYI